MKRFSYSLLLFFVFGFVFSQSKIVVKETTYSSEGKNFKSYVAYDASKKGKLPVVMIVPEWWGVNDYAKYRAKKIAELGYFAMVVDMYGDGKSVETPQEAQELATPFYQNAVLAKQNFDVATAHVKTFKNANSGKIAAIGYCFGGAMVLNMARQNPDLKGVVSFHGNLMTGVKPIHNNVKILVCNGAADNFVPEKEIEEFKKEMTDNKFDYQFINYPNAVHAFTNPNSTAVGKKFNMNIAYNKSADVKSWQEMKTFLAKIFK